MMKYLCYIFGVVTIILMCYEFSQQQAAFTRLNNLLSQYLYIEEIKLNVAILYSISVHLRWLSHSLYMNSKSQFKGEWNTFYEDLLSNNLYIMIILKIVLILILKKFRRLLIKNMKLKYIFINMTKQKNINII